MGCIYKEAASDHCEDMLDAYLATKPEKADAINAKMAADLMLCSDEIYAIEAKMVKALK